MSYWSWHESKDYNFSRRMMEEHWHSGGHDVSRVLKTPGVLERPDDHEGIRVYASDRV